MSGVIRPTCFGKFCPADASQLREQVDELLTLASAEIVVGAHTRSPLAIIAPHAGYGYSGPIAASAYALLADCQHAFSHVVLLGTCHVAGTNGLVATTATSFWTPLGNVDIDCAAVERAIHLPGVKSSDEVHVRDHALAVQLPFLQVILREFSVLPLLVGRCEADQVAGVLQEFWQNEETLLVVSSDLSHYQDHASAQRIDSQTAASIVELDPEGIGPHQACGFAAIGGLLLAARRRGLTARQVDLRTSGDTAGPRERVVGYGAFVFEALS